MEMADFNRIAVILSGAPCAESKDLRTSFLHMPNRCEDPSTRFACSGGQHFCLLDSVSFWCYYKNVFTEV